MRLIKQTQTPQPTNFKNFVEKFFNDEFDCNTHSSFSPQVDIAETGKEFEIQMHVPGIKKEDIKIDLNHNNVVISGERKIEEKKEEKNFHSIESYYGTFSRSFYLPEIVNKDKIDALYENGILKIVLPKDDKKIGKKQVVIK